MSSLARLLAAALLVVSTTTAAADPPGIELQTDRAALMTAAEWADYADRVSDALYSENAGIRECALRMTVLYADQLAVDRLDVFEIARIYRNDPDPRMRRLAVVALNAVDDDWGMDLLARSYRFETVKPIKYTIAASLLEHANRHRTAIIEVGEPTVVWPVN